MTKTENLKKRSKKETVKIKKTKKPAENANKSAADDELKDEATESDSAYQSSTEELEEASDDKVNDDDVANLGVEPKTAPKSQTEYKPKNKPIPESKPPPNAGETGYSPASFGNYTCPRCDIKFPYKNPLNSHRLNKQASFPCERRNRKARYRNSFDKHMIGHKNPENITTQTA